MRTLIVYYSRTGLTELVAKKLAQRLSADMFRLKEDDEYRGPLGYLRAGRRAMRKEKVQIRRPDVDLTSYDMVVIGGPVWAGTMTPAIRAFLINYVEQCKNIAFFQTMGAKEEQKCFANMKKIAGKPKATLAVRSRLVKNEEYVDELNRFARKINSIDL